MDQPIPAGKPEPPDSVEYLGSYLTQGGSNTLELFLKPGGSLGGAFRLGGEVLEVRSVPGPVGALYGVLVDSQAEAVAMFRASLVGDALTLELDIPGPQPDFSEAETLQLTRVQAPLEEG